jgi:hypothetical protein
MNELITLHQDDRIFKFDGTAKNPYFINVVVQ